MAVQLQQTTEMAQVDDDLKIGDTAPSAKTMAKFSNQAPIKPEFIDHNFKPKLAEEYLPKEVSQMLKDEAAALGDSTDKQTSEPPTKRPKLKGRNKKRPFEKNPLAKDKICPQVLAETECRFGPDRCKFSHDVDQYLASKPPDLGERCYNYDTYGKCRYSLACRYGSSHISPKHTNIVNEELYSKDACPVQNILDRDLQKLLWKKKYDFQKADQAHKAGKKIQESAKNSDKKNTNVLSPNNCEGEAAAVDGSKGRSSGATIPPEAGVDASPANSTLELQDDNGVDAEVKKVDFRDKLYLAPLTTVGNLPFRRICKRMGADVTCGEMALCTNLLQGQQSEWALLKRHETEDFFGVQLCGAFPDTMTRCSQLICEKMKVDFIDINCGCPIDLMFKRGEGSALMGRLSRFEHIVRSMSTVMTVPLTVKIRTGIYEDKSTAHTLLPQLRDWGASLVTLHGRSREQRYTRLADWDYIQQCAAVAQPMPVFGNGDILSYEDYVRCTEQTGVSGAMIARGALIKPWVFTEIKERRTWDISATERLDMLRDFSNYGLEHWGSDQQGVTTTRRFLLEWLSFLYRYIPVGLLERLPQKINEQPPHYFGRNDLETMMASPNCADWIKLSEMLLGPVPDGFVFLPKHKANAYI